MATISTNTYLDDGTARTAGEAWTINSAAVFTIRTDTRWHAGSPASMTGSLGTQTINEGQILYDGRNVRWLAFDSGTGTVPAIGTTITQGAVSGYLLGVYADLTSAPTAVAASMPTSGFIKFREVTGGTFAVGALTGIGASATAADVTGWIEIVADSASNIVVPRLGTFMTRGDWFYLDNTTGVVGQVVQIPTNGGGSGTRCPGVWIETGVGTNEYEFWPALNDTTNGWRRDHLGAAYSETDNRQNFVKDLGNGQIQIGEASDLSGTYANIAAQASTYASIAHSCTYTWAADIVTVYYSFGHLMTTGQQVHLDFTSGGATSYDGIYTITVIDPYYYTVSLAGSGTAGNVTARPGHTVTFTAHGLGVNDQIYCDFTSGAGVDGTYTIYAVTGTGTYLISAPHATTTSGNVSVRSRLRIACDRHLLVAGNRVYLDFSSGDGVDGVYTIINPTSNASATATYTWASDVVTVTLATHGFRVGDTVYLDFTSGGGTPDGNYVIVTVPTTGTFTVALTGSGTSGNVTVYRSFFDIVHAHSADTSGSVTIKQTIGNIPASGRKIRIPNVIMRECATASRASNLAPNATLATRPEMTTTNAGTIDMQYAYTNWYNNFAQAYSVKLSYFATFDTLLITECATEFDLDDVGLGMYGGLDTISFVLTSNFAGGTITKGKFHRGNTPGTSDHSISVNYCNNLIFTNVEAGIIQYARSTGRGFYFGYCDGLILNNCRTLNNNIDIVTCFNVEINNLDFCSRFMGYTNATGESAITASSFSDKIVINGVTFGYNGVIPNVHPMSQIIYLSACTNTKIRNLGSSSSWLKGGTWRPNFYAPAFIVNLLANCNTVKIQRCYLDTVRTAFVSGVNSNKNIIYENIYCGFYVESARAIVSSNLIDLNSTFKGCRYGVNYTTAQASVYGSHFFDIFLGSTYGRYVLQMNESTAETSSYFTLVSGNAKFNSAGGVLMTAIGDQAIWEDSIFRLGHTGFTNSTPTMSGGTASNYTIEYQIDTGSGWNGTWRTANGTNLSAETIDPSVGFKLKVRITTTVTNTTAITFLRFNTTTTAAAQTNLYPLDTIAASVYLYGLQSGSEIHIYRVSDMVELGGIESSGTTFTYNYTWTGTDVPIYITVTKPGYQWLRYDNQTLDSGGIEIPVMQSLDRVYSNPA